MLKYTSEWHPIHVVNSGAMLALNRDQAQRPDISFYSLAMIDNLISRRQLTVQDSKNVVRLSAAAIMLHDEEDIDMELDKELEKLQQAGVGEAGRNILRLLSLKFARESSSAVVEENPDQVEVSDIVDSSEPNPNQNEIETNQCAGAISDQVGQPNKRRRTDGSFDVKDRDLGKLNTKEKLNMIRRIEQERKGLMINSFTSSLRTLYYSVVIPVLKCLRDHCGDDDNEFCRRWGASFSHTDWKKKRCPGQFYQENSCGYQSK